MNESIIRSGVRPLALAVALALGATAAQAATITVTTGGDAGTTSTCTLRQAIVSANTDSAAGSSCVAGTSGADTINFDASLTNATITLAGGELDISADLTLVGSGQTIDAAGASRVLNGGYDSINGTGTPINLAVSNLTLTGGVVTGNDSGGGIYLSEYSTLSLSRVTVSGNSARWGGGIYCWGYNTISITDSTISGNTSSSTGGGIYVWQSTLTVANSTISGNTTTEKGGGIMVESSPSTVTLTNSTLTGNTAYDGGGIYITSGNAVTIADSTISGNTATAAGGGILVGSYDNTLKLDNDIVAANMSADTPNHDLGVAVGGGEGPIGRPDKRGGTVNRPMAASTITPQFTLLGASLQATYTGNGNVFSDNPGLGALANNGGPTWTLALQPGSPAIDVGNNALVPAGTTADQRGTGFARVFNGTVDMGAYEVQGGGTPIPQYVPVPVRAPWALGLLAMLLGFVGVRQYRRRREA